MKAKRKRPKNRKPAKRNQRGLNRLIQTTEQLREEYETKYPFAVDYDAVSTPEGYPTFEEFVTDKEASRAYTKADPLWQYQKTTQLGPLAFQRWRGAKSSKDGLNYRLPYFVLPSSESYSAKDIKAARQAGDAGKVVGTAGLTTDMSQYKKGHRKFLEQRTTLDKIKGIPGSIAPIVNYITGGGASIGGRNIPEALGALWLGKSMSSIPKPSSQEAITAPQVANAIGSWMSMPAYMSSDVVVPTAGLKFNPFRRMSRTLKREARKDMKSLDEKLNTNSRQYEREEKKEKAKLERYMKLYEKRYGVRPTIPSNTMGSDFSKFQPGGNQ